MLDSVFAVASHPNVESAFELGMVLVPATILAVTTVRLAVSAISAVHQKEKHSDQVSLAGPALSPTLCGSPGGQSVTAKSLSPDVKKLMIRNDRRRAQFKYKGFK
jgi:hypothetical protein